MRKNCLKVPIILILFFAGALKMLAQNVTQTDWNQVLDKYEQICNQCISLRGDIQNGIQVQAGQVSSLFQELARLRTTLQNASGSMTVSQKRRFSEIRDRYQSRLDSSANQADAVSQPVSKSSVITQSSPRFLPLDTRIAAPDFEALAAPPAIPDSFSLPYNAANNYLLAQSEGNALKVLEQESISEHKGGSSSWRVNIIGVVDFGKETQYGLTLTVGMKKYGLLIGGVSNFRTVQSKYNCYKDGSIDGGGYIWGDGRVADSRFRLMAGMYWSPVDKLMIYANSGFSNISRYWHDTQGQWARVIDLSGRGVLFGAGVIVPIRHLSLTSGIQYDTFIKSVTFNVGVGFNFS